MASVKFVAVSRGLGDILDYVEDREKTTERLITGVNCVAETALYEYEAVKKQFRQTDGRGYYHIVQAFSPDDPVDFDTAHQIGLEFAGYFTGHQCLVATHMNTRHIHNHIIMNSVNYENGRKFHQSAREMQQAKDYSNQLCMQHGLSITETRADPYEIPLWKKNLRRAIRKAMELSYDQESFIRCMEIWGYGVKWEPEHKYITYTTPENIRCRDNKLFDAALTRANMELYFELGGREYLEERQAWRESGQPEPTLDDALAGLASILDALINGDNDRFHLETVHHSDEEIERILAHGGKIDGSVKVAVSDQDEEEEFSQYHGFSMMM